MSNIEVPQYDLSISTQPPKAVPYPDISAMTIGWIGTGVMGKSMAKLLIKKGFKLLVYNRTAHKADELVELGATFMKPIEIAKRVDVLIMMLGYPIDVKKMVLDPEVGILKHMKKGSYLIDHTTSSPELANEIAKQAKEYDVWSIDAPVSGGDLGARNGCLVTMVGGEQEPVEFCRDLMDTYSCDIRHMGIPGTGQHTKSTNQIMVSAQHVGVCEALIYGYKAGLRLDQVMKVLDGGEADGFLMHNVAPRMLRRDFSAGFYVEHLTKDLGIVMDSARAMGITLPGTSLGM